MHQEQASARLDDGNVELELDARGRVVRFRSRETGTDFLTCPGLEDNWKIMVLADGYAIDYILGKDQRPDEVSVEENRVSYAYRSLRKGDVEYPIDVVFSAWLDQGEARFDLQLTNGHNRRVREVWCPILAGFEGWTTDGEPHRVDFAKARTIAHDILHKGLPDCEYLFCVDGETARYTYPGNQMNFIDLYGDASGLYVSSDDRSYRMSTIQLEKYPPEAGAGGERTYGERHLFPEDTARWITISIGTVTEVDPGQTWQSAPAILWPHQGDWHAAATHYREQVDRWMTWPERPPWLDDYVGWQHLVGKTYLEEHYHTFEQFTDVMIEGQAKTGIDVLMLYGHTEYGCESANFDISPGTSLGGPEGFRRMCDELHRRGMRVLVFGHRQSAIAIDDPEYPRFRPWVIVDREKEPRREVWYKTTIESLSSALLSHYEGTGPIWNRVCPYCDEWWESYRDELLKLIDLGLDGYQMDTLGAEGTLCFADDHGHAPGASPMPKLAERLAWIRREILTVKPDFLMAGEELRDWQFQWVDLPYSRYRNHDGYQVFRYAFPETEENVAVGAYSYDQANKAFMLGIGINAEVWGLKKSVLVCPELADYIGGIVKIRRSNRETLMTGRYTDTIGADVTGDVHYGVHRGPELSAVVVWNDCDASTRCTVAIDGASQAVISRPLHEDESVSLPAEIIVEAHRALAVIPVS
jgi:hypothetical protein